MKVWTEEADLCLPDFCFECPSDLPLFKSIAIDEELDFFETQLGTREQHSNGASQAKDHTMSLCVLIPDPEDKEMSHIDKFYIEHYKKEEKKDSV